MMYQLGEFVLDTKRHELTRNGLKIKIRRKVFELLTYLLENSEKLVSKQELIDQIWPNRTISDATLNSSIKDVRRAISDSKFDQKILTVYGNGYRYIADVGIQNDERSGSEGPNNLAIGPRAGVINDSKSKYSIAVLPFVNVSGDQEQDYFADGITDNISTDLSRIGSLFVISRTSSFFTRDVQYFLQLDLGQVFFQIVQQYSKRCGHMLT